MKAKNIAHNIIYYADFIEKLDENKEIYHDLDFSEMIDCIPKKEIPCLDEIMEEIQNILINPKDRHGFFHIYKLIQNYCEQAIYQNYTKVIRDKSEKSIKNSIKWFWEDSFKDSKVSNLANNEDLLYDWYLGTLKNFGIK